MANKDLKAQITNQALSEAVDAILTGMDDMFKDERNFNVQTFATKKDLKREASWLKDDIKGLTADLSGIPTKREFNELKGRVGKLETVVN